MNSGCTVGIMWTQTPIVGVAMLFLARRPFCWSAEALALASGGSSASALLIPIA